VRPPGQRAGRLPARAAAAAGTWTSADLVAFLRELPASGVPRVVVLDNAGLHTSTVVRAARPGLAQLGIYLYYLPPYSPDLNRVETVFRQVKYQRMPTRSYAELGELRLAVEQALRDHRKSLTERRKKKLRPCA
jgi:putative transposase